jgi:hypothetical protein
MDKYRITLNNNGEVIQAITYADTREEAIRRVSRLGLPIDIHKYTPSELRREVGKERMQLKSNPKRK